MSPDMQRAFRLIRIEEGCKRQDKLFERNMRIKQKMAGTIICLLSIAGWWFFSEFFGQFELGLFVPPFMFFGIYLLTTKQIIEREN